MESAVHAAVPLRVGKKMRKRRELDALVAPGSRGGRLLSASSDEGEPWGRRTSRRRRSRPFVRLAAALALCVCVVSAATVLWLFVDVRRQIVSLRIEMDRVSTGSAGVSDALQICHSTAKDLHSNATYLKSRIEKLELEHQDLIHRVDKAAKALSEVSEQLSAAPKLADTPRRLAELQRTVADFGSQISGFNGELTSAKKQAVTAVTGVEEVRALLKQLDARTNETIANLTAAAKQEEEMKGTLLALNTTIVSKVDALRTSIEEITLKNKAVSAAALTPAITSSTAPPPPPPPAPALAVDSVTPTPTTTLPPGPPAKPSVLQ